MRRQMKDVGLANDGIIYDTFLGILHFLTHDTWRMLQSLLQGSIASTIASGSVVSRPYYSGTQKTHKPASLSAEKKLHPAPTNHYQKILRFFFAKIPPISYLASGAIRAANLRPRTYALQEKEKVRGRGSTCYSYTVEIEIGPFFVDPANR